MSTSAFDIQNSEFKALPKIRFKGFGGEWVEKRLGDLCKEFHSGKFISASKISEHGAYPVYGGNGLRGFTSTFNHDGLYLLIGRQGALCGNTNLFNGKAFFTEHAIAVQANDNNDTVFLFYLFGKMDLGQYSSQSAQPGLAVNKLQELRSSICAKIEQTQIGEYFRELDSLIGLHQRKHDKLVTLKKAMLQKMFPRPGTTTPEIRFKGFSGDWAEKNLGEIGVFYRGISYNHNNVSRSGLLVLRSTNIQNAKLILNSDLQFIDLKCPEEIILKKGDIAICMSNGSKSLVGKSAICEITPASTTTVGAFCSIFRSANPIAPYLLQTATYSKYLTELLAGSSINNLKNSDLCELVFGIPQESAEQQKIGTYFRTLDTLIAQHATQLQKLQQIKSACLGRMMIAE